MAYLLKYFNTFCKFQREMNFKEEEIASISVSWNGLQLLCLTVIVRSSLVRRNDEGQNYTQEAISLFITGGNIPRMIRQRERDRKKHTLREPFLKHGILAEGEAIFIDRGTENRPQSVFLLHTQTGCMRPKQWLNLP